jgi:iron complex outermembrane receptor protein
LISVLVFSVSGNAQNQQGQPATKQVIEGLKRLSVEELMQQPVTTVARRTSTLEDSAAAVTVITQDDIRRSGALYIPELFRRVPGADVARINANAWAVSIRGFNDRFANKLLVQIDGRTAYNPLFAGVYWDQVDYPLEDIERIEVIRGPGASVWGANAVNGVINIITKSAKDTTGGLLPAGGGNETLAFGTLRYSGTYKKNVKYRAYVKGFDQGDQFSSERPPNDQWWTFSSGARMDWLKDKMNTLTIDGGYLRSVAGQSNLRPLLTPPFVFANFEDENANTGFVRARWTHQRDDNNQWTLQAYWDHVDRLSDNLISNWRWDTLDVDYSRSLLWRTRHEIVYGLDYRYIDFFGGKSAHDNGFTQDFIPPNRHLQLGSAFVEDEFTLVPDKLFVTGGSKFEHNDFNGFEIQPTARLLWTRTKNQSAWFAFSKAVRTPVLGERNLRITGAPVTPGVLPQVEPNPDFEAEKLFSYELGYRAHAAKKIAVDGVVFYNVYDDLSVGQPLPTVTTVPPIIAPLIVTNQAFGTTHGLELAVTWQAAAPIRIYGAYTFFKENIHSALRASAFPPELTMESPRNQGFLQISLDLPHDIDFEAIGRAVSRLPGLIPPATPGYVELDLPVTWRPKTKLAIEIVGQNLLHDHHPEFGTNPFIRTTVTEIERSVYGKVTWRF